MGFLLIYKVLGWFWGVGNFVEMSVIACALLGFLLLLILHKGAFILMTRPSSFKDIMFQNHWHFRDFLSRE